MSGVEGKQEWWRTAVVYQVYIRSFADGNGDGLGDIAGLRDRLAYLRDLGVDAIWINPWYPSPQIDAGYDVADYRAIEPAYGTIGEAEELIAEAHELGLRVILDIVPNHTSWEHAWFRAALAADEAARERYHFRPGRGEHGELPPNDWESVFGGPAWTRSAGADGEPGDWYLHLFAPAQPDLNWANPEVVEEFEDVLRFWFDKGVDGFRIDVAHGLAKHPDLPDAGPGEREDGEDGEEDPDRADHPGWDQDGVHEIYRGWRKVADEYDDRVFVAEAWVTSNERLSRYLRPDELHTAFQFDFLQAPFVASVLHATIDEARAAAAAVGAPPTWVLSNHDVVRHVTRYARPQPEHAVSSIWEQARWHDGAPDLALGVRRARAAALLTLGLPGTAYVYQGEELGLAEVEDLPVEARQDPAIAQSDGEQVGRDGCRVPLPWSGQAPPYGFSPEGASAEPWLPQPDDWAPLTAEAEAADPASMLNLYRRALALRGTALRDADFAWVPSPPGTLAFARGDVQVWLNTSDEVIGLPGELLLGSDPSAAPGTLPSDAAAWVQV